MVNIIIVWIGSGVPMLKFDRFSKSGGPERIKELKSKTFFRNWSFNLGTEEYLLFMFSSLSHLSKGAGPLKRL